MNDCVILYRVNGGIVQFVMGADGELSVFNDQDEAISYADRNKLFQSGQANYQIVVLDEL